MYQFVDFVYKPTINFLTVFVVFKTSLIHGRVSAHV